MPLSTPLHSLNLKPLQKFCALALCVVLAQLAALGPTEAQRATTRVIASETVSTSSRQVVLDGSKTRGAFRNIRLINAGGGRIQFSGLRLIYADGTSDRIARRFSLRPGERTRVLNRGNKAKFVDKLILDVRSVRRRRNARIRLEMQGTQTAREARLSRRGGVAVDPGDHDVLFGQRTVDLAVDRDEIKIPRNIGRFSHLRLDVFESDVYVRDVRIDYRDGTVQFVPIEARIKSGGSSDWFKVKPNRFIEKIVLIYRADRGKRKTARVEVSGQYAKNWLDPSGDGRKYNNGWVLLGAETAGTVGYDSDTINVGKNKGGFKELRLKVHNRSITLREVKIVFENGQSSTIKMTRRVDPGEIVGPIKVADSRAAIAKIVAKYRSRLFFGKGKGIARVEVWGRH